MAPGHGRHIARPARRVRSRWLVAETRAVRSLLPVTAQLPSGPAATAVTGPASPASTARSWPEGSARSGPSRRLRRSPPSRQPPPPPRSLPSPRGRSARGAVRRSAGPAGASGWPVSAPAKVALRGRLRPQSGSSATRLCRISTMPGLDRLGPADAQRGPARRPRRPARGVDTAKDRARAAGPHPSTRAPAQRKSQATSSASPNRPASRKCWIR